MTSVTTDTPPVVVAAVVKPVVEDNKDSLSPSVLDLKDRRAYEHLRHKVKKAADTMRMRAQKRKAPIPTQRSSPRTKSVVDNDESFGDAVLVASDNVNRERDREPEENNVKFDVKLSDLVTSPKRKATKRRDSDFEVIPHVRSVIVLDDVVTRDLVIDEPWEHVSSDEDSDTTTVKTPTYATVLSSK